MSTSFKDQKSILDKLGIEKLNAMQEDARSAIESAANVVLLSPTGTGKTLAFLLPLIEKLDRKCKEIQIMIVVPSRELAIQIEQVVREMGTGYKVNAFYGGQSFNKDRIQLKHPPTILVGTPGRLCDHLRRRTFSTEKIHALVLDEFDKSLEVGFEIQMNEITDALKHVEKRILTSATNRVEIPSFMVLHSPKVIDHLEEGVPGLQVRLIRSDVADRRGALVKTLHHIGNQPGIIFCNLKDTIAEVSRYLEVNDIEHGCFYGGMEQKDRERALIKFRNGTHQIIVATDLASRGLDIPELKFIIHYNLPDRKREFTHRNGRTARMHNDGTAYILQLQFDRLPEFIGDPEVVTLRDAPKPEAPIWATLFVSGGRQDKISKGDIAGLFFKQGQLEKGELGVIELKHDCAFVAVPLKKARKLIQLLDNSRIKKRKVRISLI
ncbi:MAG: DEAD/DEAH box helicase [Bacteroidetes bacterium]|nr:DEAD/DEAH box helicase [Bacteroidota bacterium]